MILLEDITDLTIRDVTLRDAAFWTLHMAGCRRVRIRDIRILNDDRGANNDGIDPDCCQDVIISGCLIHTGDDAIVVKATGPMTRRYGPCCNVTITNCVLHSRDSALKIGTETCGDIRNITFGDCLVKDCSRGRRHLGAGRRHRREHPGPPSGRGRAAVCRPLFGAGGPGLVGQGRSALCQRDPAGRAGQLSRCDPQCQL